MDQVRRAIILKSYLPNKKKIALLDDCYGRLDGIPDTERLSPGALIVYTSLSQTTNSLIRNVEQVAMPFSVACDDIAFLHHVLEICYYSIPPGVREPDIFDLLSLLYENKILFSNSQKRIFLVNLFLLLHLHSYDLIDPNFAFFRHGVSKSIDMKPDHYIDLNMAKKIDRWLMVCIDTHPYRDHFKTMDFYKRMTLYERM